MTPNGTVRESPRQVDDSMHLLLDLYRGSVDPDYQAVTRGSRRPWWVLLAVMVLFGIMVGTAVAGNLRSAPAAQAEREELIARVRAAAERQDALRARVNELTSENRQLSEAALRADPDSSWVAAQNAMLEISTGMRAVSGRGVVMVVDDADDPKNTASRVVDIDLRQAANGLWQAGAEAIAINGHRLSARTSIRGAGSAITVDYRSLTPPYRIEAIGDQGMLVTRFPQTPGGAWWAYLRQNYDMRYELTAADDLRLSADPGLGVRYASVSR